MTGSHQSSHPSHHVRFYIVMITLVLGGIFFLLSINNDDNGLSFTSAITGSSTNKSLDALADRIKGAEQQKSLEETFSSSTIHGTKDVPVTLAFNQVPKVKKEAKLKELVLRFDDLTTTIKVNNDKLELNDLREVGLRINDFQGAINFDGNGFSLDGTARRIEVNDVAFSSENNLAISFDNLKYKSFVIADIALKDVTLNQGDGELRVGSKLTYALEQDSITFYAFAGQLLVDKASNTTSVTSMDGFTQGLGISGQDLDINVW